MEKNIKNHINTSYFIDIQSFTNKTQVFKTGYSNLVYK